MNTRRRGGSTIRSIRGAVETVLIRRRLEYRGLELVVILQPDNSFACIPAWMTHGAAGQYTLRDKPCFSVDILRSLRAEIDALLVH